MENATMDSRTRKRDTRRLRSDLQGPRSPNDDSTEIMGKRRRISFLDLEVLQQPPSSSSAIDGPNQLPPLEQTSTSSATSSDEIVSSRPTLLRPSQDLHVITPRTSCVDLATAAEPTAMEALPTRIPPRNDLVIYKIPSLVGFPVHRTPKTIIPNQDGSSSPPRTRPTSPSASSLSARVGSALLLIILLGFSPLSSFVWNRPFIHDPNAIYVSGGGFSGFWYTLGRLKSIPDPTVHTYYCYSAGCLGAVAILQNKSMEDMYAMASKAQRRWQLGHIHRYRVVPEFLNDLVWDTNEQHLSNLRIMTTTVSNKTWIIGGGGVETAIRTPTTLPELYEMLLQTTWIPFAVGGALFHQQHMDGAFGFHQHPQCAHTVGLPLDWDLLLNVINVNLGRDKVEKFWAKGLAYGL